MKKRILFVLLPLLLAGCNPSTNSSHSSYSVPSFDTSYDDTIEPNKDEQGNYLLDFYGLNDFHGSVAEDEEESQPGFSKIATFLKEKRAENPGGTVIVSSGDMWQGSADSNITHGELVVDLMNYVGFDAMTLGNHEFDWEISQIEENAQKANFPFLGANIVSSETGQRADFALPSVMIRRGPLNIGIIGTIGASLESSIVASALAGYEFALQAPIVESESERLKNEGADTVILLTHDSWATLYTDGRTIVNNHYVDAVFSGHAHVTDRHLENNIPILQTTGMGEQIMHIQLSISATGEVTPSTYEILDSSTYVANLTPDSLAQEIYDYYYYNFIKDIKEEVVGKVGSTMNLMQISYMACYTMLQHARTVDDTVVAAFHNNYGGIRVDSWSKGQMTYGDIYKTIPFDNYISIFEVTGESIKQMANQYSAVATVKETELVNSQVYKIAIISYLSEGRAAPYLLDDGVIISGFVRDLIAQEFRDNGTVYPNTYSAYAI